MAKKKLNSIVWPNIPNDVYYLDADKVEYDDTETYSEGSVGDALQNKANIDGSYENLTAGNAEQLVTDIRANDQTPYLFRTAGGSVDIGDREYINGIVGGTVAWNQLAKELNLTNWAKVNNNGSISYSNGEITVSPSAAWFGIAPTYTISRPANHKCLHVITARTVNENASIDIASPFVDGYSFVTINSTSNQTKYAVKNSIAGTGSWIANRSNTEAFVVSSYQLFDLTQMFGSTIADYIYSLEQATAGAGVAFFKSLFPKPYYAYNAGELMSVKGLVSHDMVGFNAWDEELQNGYYDSDGSYKSSTNFKCSKNPIPALPNTTYYLKAPVNMEVFAYDADMNFISEPLRAQKDKTFVTPSNTAFLHICNYSSGTLPSYNHDICINLSWDGSRDGEYEPYQKWSYPLDSTVTLRGKFKLDVNNNLYADGDVYPPSGEVQRKWAEVDLGSLTWSLRGTGNVQKVWSASLPYDYYGYNVGALVEWIGVPALVEASNAVSLIDVVDTTPQGVYSYINAGGTTNVIYAVTSASATEPTGTLIYKLATPTTETADPYTNPQIVNDFGTEEFVISNTVDVPIPVGHNTDYPINLKAKVEMAPNSPDGDGDYIVRQTNGTNEYVSIANNSTISGLVSRSPVASGADGTYVLKATISGGTVTYSWEAE